MTSERRKRKEIDTQSRGMIASVYHFLREEYDFMKQNNLDNCDLSPLANVRKRTAEATGVSERTVTQVLKEERESASNPTINKPAKKRTKQIKSAKKKRQINDDNNLDSTSPQGLWTLQRSVSEDFQINSERKLPEQLTPGDIGEYKNVQSSGALETEPHWMNVTKDLVTLQSMKSNDSRILIKI